METRRVGSLSPTMNSYPVGDLVQNGMNGRKSLLGDSVQALLYVGFWCGVFQLVLCTMITFVPGGDQGWLVITGGFLLCGLFIPRWYYRVAALVLAVACGFGSISAKQRGIEYRRHLELRHAAH